MLGGRLFFSEKKKKNRGTTLFPVSLAVPFLLALSAALPSAFSDLGFLSPVADGPDLDSRLRSQESTDIQMSMGGVLPYTLEV